MFVFIVFVVNCFRIIVGELKIKARQLKGARDFVNVTN